MPSVPLSHTAAVIAFRPRPATWAGLTTWDRIEILQWRERRARRLRSAGGA